tara:strand:+ start:1566 stop:1829 length:264 start_codon:yes stop_codon:yes gene_type:complete
MKLYTHSNKGQGESNSALSRRLNSIHVISSAEAEVARVERKKIHGQWVDVKIISNASCVNPINIQGEITLNYHGTYHGPLGEQKKLN